MSETEILEQIKTAYCDILRSKLVGIYVHGSIALQCFRWDCSDIDFLVIVNQTVTLQEKKLLIMMLLDLDSCCPQKGVEITNLGAVRVRLRSLLAALDKAARL